MARRKNKKKGVKWIKHYNSSHHILLVGEGDFSFAASLASAFGSANNIVATSFDSEEMVIRKHNTARGNLEFLEEMECTVFHDVDANDMRTDKRLKFSSFDRIVFNFPHAGFSYREDSAKQIELHQELVKGFLKNAYDLLAYDGEVHVTHKITYPFYLWDIKKLAEDFYLILVEEASYSRYDYPGYINRRGSGCQSNKTFLVGESRTFKFAKS